MASRNTSRVALSNRTNAICSLPTPLDERTLKRRVSTDGRGEKKRVKLQKTPDEEHANDVFHDDSMDVDVEPVKARKRNGTTFSDIRSARMRPRSTFQTISLSTRPILTTFVSSSKSDVYRLHSEDDPLTPGVPFACAFSADAKKGGVPILAVATQDGTMELLNTSKRKDWDFEPQRTTIQAHQNAVLDVKWGFGDQTLASASGDSTARITSVSTQKSLAILAHHRSSVKSLDWDPNNADLLSTAGRDGSICVWDLRTASHSNVGDPSASFSPVVIIPHAHYDTAPRGKAATSLSPSKTVTSLLYLPQNSQHLVSSCSSDGILKQWDLRYPTDGRARKPVVQFESLADPTLESGTRSRGISALALGRNYSAGVVWGLAADSCVHTYPIPFSARFAHSAPQNKLTHPSLYVNSFYVKLAASPCGSWLASGSSRGGVYLWDVATRLSGPRKAVELKATEEEISAVDWAKDSLATCCDDGTVRIWRPDFEVSSSCKADPQEKQWDWAWAKDDM